MADKNTTNREALVKVVGLVRPALAAQPYIPALTHIQFNGSHATAFNDVSAIAVRAKMDLNRCLPGDLLIRALGSFAAENILFQSNEKDGSIVLSSGRSKLKLPTLDADKFPFELPNEKSAVEIELGAGILRGIERCLISVGSDPTHPSQMGVTLDMDDAGKAVLYSTDNFTISRFQTKASIDLPGDAPVILPTFFCEQLGSLGKAFPDAPVTLIVGTGYLIAEFGDAATLFSKTLVDLEAMDFPRIVQKHCHLADLKKELVAIPDSFDDAMQRALLVLGTVIDKSTKVTVTDSMLRLHSSSDIGDSDDSMAYQGDETAGPAEPFLVDPALMARACKGCASMAFLQRVVVFADADVQFVHLVAHCNA